MIISSILYINCRLVLETYCETFILDESNSSHLSDYLKKSLKPSIMIVLFDLEGLKVNSINTSVEETKKSPVYFSLHQIVEDNPIITYIFINCPSSIANQITIRDFSDKKNIFVIQKNNDENSIQVIGLNEKPKDELIKVLKNYCQYSKNDLDFIEDPDKKVKFLNSLIGERIKELIVNTKGVFYTIQKSDIKDNIEEDVHRLKSTPVHVNKYINVKPLLEKFEILSEIAFYLSMMIKQRLGNPSYLVAPSKNSLILCSALTKYISSDIVIINQVSPITAFNNFSTINKIQPYAKYAIILDFECMGTEIKIVKSILWSHGVDLENVAAFPLISTKIFDDDNIGFEKNKIYPIYKLDDSFNYKIFTQTTCPICNSLENCEHKRCFF